jgi:outer membrane protein TolC
VLPDLPGPVPARLPSISLIGSLSSLSTDPVVVDERDDPVWGVGGRAYVPLNLGGAPQARFAVRTAEQEATVAACGGAGAAAFAAVEQALPGPYSFSSRSRAAASSRRCAGLSSG